MPKENIVSHDGSPFQTAVGWSKDHEVQVAVQVSDTDTTLLDILYGNLPAQEDIGASLVQWVIDNPLEDPQTTLEDLTAIQELGALVLSWVEQSRMPQERDGVWANLSRRACNDMIRLLRKARDVAYGRDE